MEFRINQGPAAAICKLFDNDKKIGELTLDWSYDGVYFKYYDNDYMIISIGSKTKKNDIEKLNIIDKLYFNILSNHLIKKIKGYSLLSDNALIKLQSIIDNFNYLPVEPNPDSPLSVNDNLSINS